MEMVEEIWFVLGILEVELAPFDFMDGKDADFCVEVRDEEIADETEFVEFTFMGELVDFCDNAFLCMFNEEVFCICGVVNH